MSCIPYFYHIVYIQVVEVVDGVVGVVADGVVEEEEGAEEEEEGEDLELPRLEPFRTSKEAK